MKIVGDGNGWLRTRDRCSEKRPKELHRDIDVDIGAIRLTRRTSHYKKRNKKKRILAKRKNTESLLERKKTTERAQTVEDEALLEAGREMPGRSLMNELDGIESDAIGDSSL